MVELLDFQENMLDSIQPGDKVTDNVKNLPMGTVTAVEVLPSQIQVLDEENGIIRQAERPGRYTLNVTIQAETVETETSIETVGGYVLRVGSFTSCTAGGTTGSGYILTVER